MPGPEDIIGQQLGEAGNIAETSGAERISAATALLKDFSNTLQAIISNPATSSYAFYKLGTIIQQHFITHLTKGVELTREQNKELTKLVAQSTGVLTLGGAFSGLAMRIATVTIEARKSAAEIGRFANLSSMPGGGQSGMNSILYLKQQQLKETIRINSEFAKTENEVRQQAALVMGSSPGSMHLAPGPEQDKFVKMMTAYNVGFNANALGVVQQMQGAYASAKGGGGGVLATKALGQLLVLQQNHGLGEMTPEETLATFSNMTKGLTEAGQAPKLAMQQTISMIQNHANLGPEAMMRMAGIATNLMNDPTTQKLAAINGIMRTNITNEQLATPGGAELLLASVQSWVRKTAGLKGNDTLNSMDTLSPDKKIQLNSLATAMGGIDQQDLMTMMNTPTFSGKVSDAAAAFDVLVKSEDKLKGSDAFEKMLQQLLALQSGAKGLKDVLDVIFQTFDLLGTKLGIQFSKRLEEMFAFAGKDTAKVIGDWGPAGIEALAIGGTAVPVGINAYKHLNKHFKGKILGTKSGTADVVGNAVGTTSLILDSKGNPIQITPSEIPAAPSFFSGAASKFGTNFSGGLKGMLNLKSAGSWLNYGMAAFEVGSDVYKGIENKRSAGEIATRSTGDLINLAGGIVGGALGGALGSFVGPAGTIIGGMAGSVLGSTITSYFTDKFLDKQYGGSIDRDSVQAGTTNPTTQGVAGYPTVHIVIDNTDGKQLAEANLNAAAQLRSNYIHVSIGTKGLSYG